MSKGKKIIIISLLSAVILLAVIIGCVSLLIEQKNTVDISASGATLGETSDYGQNYVNNIIFLGDESIYPLISTGVLEGGIETQQVWSGKNGVLELDYNIDKATVIFPETQEEMLIKQALEKRQPRYIVITVGAQNGVAYCEKEAFMQYYKKLIGLIKTASPNTSIILQSIFPVGAMYEFLNPEMSNAKIDKCNEWICQVAEEENVKFLYTAEYLKNNLDNLYSDYIGENGISLSAEGYAAMIAYIRTHGYRYPSTDTEAPAEEATD